MHRPSVPALEVIWTYLAHEHEHKGRHKDLVDVWRLAQDQYPVDAFDIRDVYRRLAESIAERRCPADVLATVDDWATRHWEYTHLDASDLGELNSQLPEELDPRGKFDRGKVGRLRDLLAGWNGYLTLDDPQATADAAGHLSVISELEKNGRLRRPLVLRHVGPQRWRIGDGRHRAFAVLDYAIRRPALTVGAFRERA